MGGNVAFISKQCSKAGTPRGSCVTGIIFSFLFIAGVHCLKRMMTWQLLSTIMTWRRTGKKVGTCNAGRVSNHLTYRLSFCCCFCFLSRVNLLTSFPDFPAQGKQSYVIIRSSQICVTFRSSLYTLSVPFRTLLDIVTTVCNMWCYTLSNPGYGFDIVWKRSIPLVSDILKTFTDTNLERQMKLR